MENKTELIVLEPVKSFPSASMEPLELLGLQPIESVASGSVMLITKTEVPSVEHCQWSMISHLSRLYKRQRELGSSSI